MQCIKRCKKEITITFTVPIIQIHTCEFKSCSHVILEKLCRFIKIINVQVTPPGELTITQLFTHVYYYFFMYIDVYMLSVTMLLANENKNHIHSQFHG